jgi:hypothetical protein
MAKFEDLSEAAFATVTERTARMQARQFRAVSAQYDGRTNRITIQLSNGVSTAFPTGLLPGLENASASDLATLKIEGAGYGLHVPALDADISIPQLLEDHLGSVKMKRALSRASASRENGRRGGRPKKAKAAA